MSFPQSYLQVSGREVFEFRPELVNDDDEEADDTKYAEEEEEDDKLSQEVMRRGHLYIKTSFYITLICFNMEQ